MVEEWRNDEGNEGIAEKRFTLSTSPFAAAVHRIRGCIHSDASISPTSMSKYKIIE